MPGKEAAPTAQVVDIMDLLKRSVEAAGGEKKAGSGGGEENAKKRERKRA